MTATVLEKWNGRLLPLWDELISVSRRAQIEALADATMLMHLVKYV